MPFNIFGFEFSRKKKNKKDDSQKIPKLSTGTSEGSVSSIINTGYSNYYGGGVAGGAYAYNFDINGQVFTSSQMLEQYRQTACYPDVDTAIESIVNDAVIVEQGVPPVSLNLDNLDKQFEGIKESILTHFDHVINLLDFNKSGHDIFKRWYIDGRIYYYVNVDTKNPKKGILSLDYIDPLKIRKVVEYVKRKDETTGVEYVADSFEYYLFNDNGLAVNDTATSAVRLSTESVINVQSGLVDPKTKETLSYLFKAIKPANQLKMMEDAVVIYRITRAPERRAFYIDVGNLPAGKAEQYVNSIIEKFRNKIVYDATTGEIKNNRQYLSMLEDFFLPRREGGKSTEISVLPSASNLDSIGDIVYFQNKLYQALNVPKNRLNPETVNSIGTSNEVTREEIVFSKFIQRLRNKFNILFQEALRIELLLSNVVSEGDWEIIKDQLFFEYQHDNYFEELKRLEVNSQKYTQLQIVDGYKGVYFSKKYIVNNILGITDQDWETMKEEMYQEKLDEARETFDVEKLPDQLAKELEEKDQETDDQGSSDDEDYNDFIDGKEPSEEDETGETDTDEETPDEDSDQNEQEEVDSTSQEGDTTETIDDTQKPNEGEEPFTRPAETGLKATQ